MTKPPDMSIIVPARNEAAMIGRTLAAVAIQMDRSRHELLVIDSASDDGTGDIARLAGARVVRLETPGQLIAKRRGVDEARGRLIVMLDADCVPQPGWMAAIESAFSAEPEMAAATRCYGYGPDCPSWARAYLGGMSLMLVHSRRLLRLSQTFVRGGNVAFQREAITAEAYPPDGCIADTEVALGRIIRRTGPVRYVAGMRVVSDARRFRQSPWRFFRDYQWGAYLRPMIMRRRRGRA